MPTQSLFIREGQKIDIQASSHAIHKTNPSTHHHHFLALLLSDVLPWVHEANVKSWRSRRALDNPLYPFDQSLYLCPSLLYLLLIFFLPIPTNYLLHSHFPNSALSHLVTFFTMTCTPLTLIFHFFKLFSRATLLYSFLQHLHSYPFFNS